MMLDKTPSAFICGALRSGTTMLSLMLNSHPRLSNPGELDFLFEAPRRANGEPDLDAYVRRLQRDRIFRSVGAAIDKTLEHDALVQSFARQLAAPGKRLTITVHRNFDRIPDIFPEARFVHLLRDPRDVARSSIQMGWAGHVYFGVDHWIDTQNDFAKLRRRVDPRRIVTLTYEALVRDPGPELARLCAFLGEEFDPAMLDYAKRSTYSAPDASLLEQWRRKLSPREVALVEARVGDMLEKSGYAASGYPQVRPNAIERFMLRQISRAKRNQFELRRFGFAPFLARKVSAVAPIPRLSAYAAARYDAITEQHLK